MPINLSALDIEAPAELLRAIAHAVRLDLLRTLTSGERSVSDLEAATGIVQPGLSQQLGILRKADLVLTRREAKQVFYRINHARFAELSTLLDAFADTVAVPRHAALADRMASGGGAAMFARVE
ncbi:MAG: hypothetical protein B7Y43_11980 [Sphingomonas sp. 28-62-20]|uniref:ArsR/SmtB family transcription factor n=1 Tax=Sphingomonas sp. 28-62-20 TaxID=1970433 RepID=UPI000BDD6980|nr:MAG: hypothetical protein B7Y43_11980 [Sphingomonas sp. 28-62-20]